jgi:hypothetical protein
MSSAKDFWIFRIVHQDTGKPAQGVPVTVLDEVGNPAGHWVSETDGTVTIPRRSGARVRLRVGLRNEEPIELSTATLPTGIIDLAAPTQLPFAPPNPAGGPSERPTRMPPTGRAGEAQETPPHVVYFQRLAYLPDAPASTTASDGVADFFSGRVEQPTSLHYGVLFEIEEVWQSLGVAWGELLYSVSLTPGDEARLAVLDGRWRKETEHPERPLQILARMVGTSMLGDLVTSLRPELQVEPLALADTNLETAATESIRMIRQRTERMSHALRRRPLGVVDAPPDADRSAIRTVRNTTPDRVVTFHFFEPLERFRVMLRSPRVRAVVFVPFRLPDVATPEIVRRFSYIFRRTLLDRALVPDLDRLIAGDDDAHRLLDHIAANLLYYSTAIISAGDPAARHMSLSKLRVAGGASLASVVENVVIGRVGNAVALPLLAPRLLPRALQDALTAYAANPPRVHEDFSVTIPHPGVWTTAQPDQPMSLETDAENAAG